MLLGGGGFIGSAVTERLLRGGHKVRVFERSGSTPHREFLPGEHVEWLVGDFLNHSDLSAALKEMDVLIHMVSTTLPKSSNDDPIYDVESNVVSSLHLLNEAVRQGVKKVIFVSSGGTVYGLPKYLPIDEDHATDPLVSYGITKLAIEKYMQLYQQLYDIKTISLRVSNPYGVRQRVEKAQGAVGIFIYNALKSGQIDIWGDGEVVRDYIFVEDVADAFVAAINYNGNKSVFNISSGAGVSLNELVSSLEQVLGFDIKRNYLPSRAFDVPVSVLSNHLAKVELGWMPIVDMDSGLSKTVAWFEETLNLK